MVCPVRCIGNFLPTLCFACPPRSPSQSFSAMPILLRYQPLDILISDSVFIICYPISLPWLDRCTTFFNFLEELRQPSSSASAHRVESASSLYLMPLVLQNLATLHRTSDANTPRSGWLQAVFKLMKVSWCWKCHFPLRTGGTAIA
jgi:hypothetical protein